MKRLKLLPMLLIASAGIAHGAAATPDDTLAYTTEKAGVAASAAYVVAGLAVAVALAFKVRKWVNKVG